MLEDKLGLTERKNSISQKKKLYAVGVTLAVFSEACTHVYVKDKIAIRNGPFMSEKVIAPVPVRPEIKEGDDPATAIYNNNEQKRYDCEQNYYQKALHADSNDLSMPKRECVPNQSLDLEKQSTYLKEKEDATKLRETVEILKEAVENISKTSVNLAYAPQNTQTNNNEVQGGAGGSANAGLIKDFNQDKQAVYGSKVNISLEDQYQICSETEKGKSLAEFIGQVEFKDCDFLPQKALGLTQLIEKIVGESNTFIYCGKTDPRSAFRCHSRYNNYQENLGLAWDRAYALGKKGEEQASSSTHIGFALGVTDKMATSVYRLRKGW